MRRDRMTLGMVFMLPLVQLLLFGFAIQTEVRHIPTIVFARGMASFDLQAHKAALEQMGSVLGVEVVE